MRWAIKHKSGRTLFVTSDEFIANNRRKMGWIVEEVKMTSREQFEKWFNKRSNWKITPSMRKKDGYVGNPSAQSKWEVWQASRAAIEIECPGKREREAFSTDFEDGVTFGYNDAIDAYELAIQQAGLKVNK